MTPDNLGRSYLPHHCLIVLSDTPNSLPILKKLSFLILRFKTSLANLIIILLINNWNKMVNLRITLKEIEKLANNKDIEKIFETDAICYFGPDRYEKPMWMGTKYFDLDNNLHPSVQAKFAGVLNNPISVKNVTANSKSDENK